MHNIPVWSLAAPLSNPLAWRQPERPGADTSAEGRRLAAEVPRLVAGDPYVVINASQTY